MTSGFGGHQGRKEVLTFNTDVEDVHFEADCNCGCREDQRGCPPHHLEQLVRVFCSVDHRREGCNRVFASDEEHQSGNCKSDEYRNE